MWSETKFWVLLMLIISILSGVCCFFYKYAFGLVGQGLTKNIRAITYQKILRKHIAWYDEKDNNPGNLTTLL